jgi:hypothetical protein
LRDVQACVFEGGGGASLWASADEEEAMTGWAIA